jgi:hypothetical protein
LGGGSSPGLRQFLCILAILALALASLTWLPRVSAEETLIVASMKYIKNPNPLKEETWYDWWLNLVMYDRLFREGPDLEPHPWLCSWYERSQAVSYGSSGSLKTPTGTTVTP